MRIASKFILATVLLLLHTAFVVFCWQCIRTSPDPEAGIAWGFPYLVAWPSSLLLGFVHRYSDDTFVVVLALGGGLQWFLLGFVLQWAARRLTTRSSEQAPLRSACR